MKKPFSEESRIVCGSEAVCKGQRSYFPVLGFHRPLEPLALQAKASLNEKISHSLLEWPVIPSQLINVTWPQRSLHTASHIKLRSKGRIMPERERSAGFPFLTTGNCSLFHST